MRRRLLILKTGTTASLPPVLERHGDYESWIARGMGVELEEVDVCSVYAGEAPPSPEAPAGVVVTGSPAMVSDREAWSEAAAAWLVRAVEAGTPVLGICYGHQLLAHGFGGEVGANPRGREMGTVSLEPAAEARQDPLLGDWASPTAIHTTHVESVLRLPRDACLLGASELDPHSAFRLGESAWGVQFHPEFDASIMRSYIDTRHAILAGEGLDPDAMHAAVVEAPEAKGVLSRFAALVRRLRGA